MTESVVKALPENLELFRTNLANLVSTVEIIEHDKDYDVHAYQWLWLAPNSDKDHLVSERRIEIMLINEEEDIDDISYNEVQSLKRIISDELVKGFNCRLTIGDTYDEHDEDYVYEFIDKRENSDEYLQLFEVNSIGSAMVSICYEKGEWYIQYRSPESKETFEHNPVLPDFISNICKILDTTNVSALTEEEEEEEYEDEWEC